MEKSTRIFWLAGLVLLGAALSALLYTFYFSSPDRSTGIQGVVAWGTAMPVCMAFGILGITLGLMQKHVVMHTRWKLVSSVSYATGAALSSAAYAVLMSGSGESTVSLLIVKIGSLITLASLGPFIISLARNKMST